MKIRWGVLSTARIAKNCTIPGMLKAPSCELYAIAGRNEEKVEAYKKEFGFEKGYVGYEKLLEDPLVNAVYIPLPNHLHYEWVIKALKAGKHVLCEKPLALTEDEARELFRTAKENNVILMEAYAYLHSEYIASLVKDLRSGIIGDVRYIESAFVTQGYREDVRLYKEMGGGAAYDLGCYCTTMFLTLIDSAPKDVKAIAEFSDRGVDFQTAAIIRFENGVRASFDVGMILGDDSNARFDRLYINGTRGYIKSDVEYNQEGTLKYTICSDGRIIERSVDTTHNYALEAENLSRSILGEETPHITEEFSLKNANLLDRILKEIGYR